MINIFQRLFDENEFEDKNAINFPFKHQNEKIEKKLNNAIDKYANGVLPEDVVFLHDATVFGSAKDGFLLTPTHLYSHTMPNKPILLKDVAYIKKGKVYDYSRKKIASLEPFFDEKEAQYIFEDILNKYIKINSIVEPLSDKGVQKDILIDKAFEYISKNKTVDNIGFYNYLKSNGVEVNINDDELQGEQKELAKPRFNALLKLLGVENGTFLDVLDKYVKYFIYALTPLYLVIIYYETVKGADLNSLIEITFVMFTIYIPVKMMITQKNLEFSYHAISEDKDIIQYFRYIFLFYISFIIPFIWIITLIPTWWFLSKKIYELATEVDNKDSYTLFGTYIYLVVLMSASLLSSISGLHGMDYIGALFDSFFTIVLYAIILMPPLAYTILSSLFSGFFSAGKKALSVSFSIEKILGVLLGGYLLMAISIGAVSSFINSFDAYTLAFISTTIMILTSGLGSIFQIKLFVSTFKTDAKEIQKLSIIFVGLFYAIMVVNMNIVDTVGKLSYSIKNKQEALFDFGKTFDPSDRSYRFK